MNTIVILLKLKVLFRSCCSRCFPVLKWPALWRFQFKTIRKRFNSYSFKNFLISSWFDCYIFSSSSWSSTSSFWFGIYNILKLDFILKNMKSTDQFRRLLHKLSNFDCLFLLYFIFIFTIIKKFQICCHKSNKFLFVLILL